MKLWLVRHAQVLLPPGICYGATDVAADAAATLRAAQALAADQAVAKGDVLAVARIAGIMAAKCTADLIPLCHPLPLDAVTLELVIEVDGVRATASVITTHGTGVEMEAMTAVSVALLTIYDMAKAMDRGMTISGVRLLKKSGGRSGEWLAP